MPRNLVIRASAGTGKTFQLSNRFLGLVAADEPLESILAVTFTRKGAGEILDRVLLRLAQAASDPARAADLGRFIEVPSLDQQRCQVLLQTMLRGLHRLRTGTLDSFFIQVARAFSLELGQPHGWQIADEILDGRLRAEAIRIVLGEESTGDVVRLMNLLTKGEAARSISEQISSLVEALYSVYLESPPEAWRSIPRRKLLSAEELQAAVGVLAGVALPADKRFAGARDQDLEGVEKGDWGSLLVKGLGAKAAQGEESYYKKTIPADVLAAYRPLVEHAKAFLLQQIANQTEATYDLLQRFDAVYRRLKLAQRAMRFEDVTRLLGESALDGRMDQIAYRLDGRLSHLLLDEFQDTSPVQWRVVRRFAQRIFSAGGRGSFFCVGDVKQAIFGWRGGVAEIFDTLETDLPKLSRQALSMSFRSSPVVIDTVNRVFQGLGGNAALRNYAAAAEAWAGRFQTHTTKHAGMPGYCRLLTARQAAEGDKQAVETQLFAAGEIARIVSQAPGRSVGVLVRTNQAVARMIFALGLEGVEASEEGGNPLGDAPAVQLLLSALRLADHPGDTAARFHVARSPLGAPLGLTDHQDAPAAADAALRIRRRLMDDGYGRTLDAWTRLIAPGCDPRDAARLRQLVELGFGYDPLATARPGDFVSLVEQRRVESPSSAPVRVMTFHQSKGLQFDVVVLPELDYGLAGQPPQLVVGRPEPTAPLTCVCRYVASDQRSVLPKSVAELFDAHGRQRVEESLCVLYVAMTRAVHALEMIVAPAKSREKNMPGTAAGLLRAALAPGAAATADEVLFELGDRRWHGIVVAQASSLSPGATGKMPVPLAVPLNKPRLASPAEGRRRGREVVSPSQLEGGARVKLAGVLRLDTSAALDRGTLMHACFEQVHWLDDGPPEESALRQAVSGLAAGGTDLGALIAEFKAALKRPAIADLLTLARYESPVAFSGVAAGANETRPVSPGGHAGPNEVRPVSPGGHAGPNEVRPVSPGGHAGLRLEVEREWPFLVREGERILSGQIDRLVLWYDGDRPSAADVIDFKTDRLDPGNLAALADRVEHYRPQLEAYRRALTRLFRLPADRVSARLVFAEPGIVEVL
jgi:ATP-dependent exoDNAse (exonuclease V) beta subunit